MIIHFKRSEIEKLVAHVTSQTEHKALYEQAETAKPGLWLVGDEGVYLMCNTKVTLPKGNNDEPGADTSSFVAYADEVNPKTLAFDDWWGNKRECFGGDDGVEFIPYAGSVESPGVREWLAGSFGELLQMELTPQSYSLILPDAVFALPEPDVGAVRKAAGSKAVTLFEKGIGWKYLDVPVRKMDREGLIIYIGGLKNVQEQDARKLKSAEAAIKIYESTITELNKKLSKYEDTGRASGRGKRKPQAKKSAAGVSKQQKSKR